MNRIFDAASITDLQACPRRFVLNSSWRPLRWRPKELFDAILRRAMLHLSQRKTVDEVRVAARSQYLQSATNPGLDVSNPYPIAMEYVALLNVLVTALARLGIPPNLKEGPVIPLDGASWRTLSFVNPGSQLHRWITVDHWDEARQRRELHSWWVAGDIAVMNLPMTIHILEIGQMRNERLSSLWVKGYRHPKLPNVKRVRFRLRDREGSFKSWDPVRFVDLHLDVESWVEMLFADEVPQFLYHAILVDAPAPKKLEACLGDLLRESAKALRLSLAWRDLPMSRGACDFPYSCPFQPVCYEDADPELSGLFVPRESLKSSQTAAIPPSLKA